MAFGTTSNKQSFPFYGGGQVPNPANVITATIAPSTAATANAIGTIWVNTSAGTAYLAVKNTGINGTVTWDQLGLSTGTVGSLTGDSGGAITPTAGNINTLGGTGLSTSGSGSTMTFNVIGGGFKTSSVAGTTQTVVANTRYFAANASATTFTTPASPVIGDSFAIVGNNANTGGWVIQLAGTQVIHFVGGDTSAGGTVTSNTKYDSIQCVCTVAGAAGEWTVVSLQGTPTPA